MTLHPTPAPCAPPTRNRRAARSPAGFTLVELLVVIGIIALLISILLPSLASARRSAVTIQCAANMRSILQGMQIYAAESNNYIPGSPSTSGYGLIAPNSTAAAPANVPELSQVWDFQAPIAKKLGIRFNAGASLADRTERFVQLTSNPVFTCPANRGVLATAFGTPDLGAQQYISYSTSMMFLFGGGQGLPVKTGISTQGVTRLSFIPLPSGYAPKLNKVGSTSEKVYLMEGARYSQSAAPTYNMALATAFGGNYSDYGGWSKFSNGQNRALAPGNSGTGALDSRLLWARHGRLVPRGPSDSFRSNYGFFDGHVEARGDLAGSNPKFFLPKGTKVNLSGEAYPDVVQQYYPGLTTVTVP